MKYDPTAKTYDAALCEASDIPRNDILPRAQTGELAARIAAAQSGRDRTGEPNEFAACFRDWLTAEELQNLPGAFARAVGRIEPDQCGRNCLSIAMALEEIRREEEYAA